MDLAFIDGAELRERLTFESMIEALRAGHRGEPPHMERTLMTQQVPGSDTKGYLAWHAWAHERELVVKLVTAFPGNGRLAPPRPSVQGLYVVLDGVTGSPTAVLDAAELTSWKTAADTALGASYLARTDARTMLVVGAGAIAPYHVAALRTVRPSLDEVLLWNRTPDKARQVANDPRVAGTATVVDDLDAAVARADIVCCLTSTTAPVLRGAALKPGAFVALVGGYTPEMREADDDVVRRGHVFVDSRWFTVEHCGDLIDPIASGVLAPGGVEADLFELCQGLHPGRRTADEITVFKNGGGAHLDLFAARHAVATLRA